MIAPESFNRLKNPSREDLDRFTVWLFSRTLRELRAARGDMAATRAAWISYFRAGLKADLLLDQLMAHLPELFRRAQYPQEDAKSILEMIKKFSLVDILPPGD